MSMYYPRSSVDGFYLQPIAPSQSLLRKQLSIRPVSITPQGVSGFLVNYSASSYVLDVLNHNEYFPCTHCSFMCRLKESVSRYSYYSAINSYNSSYTRGSTTTMVIRSISVYTSRGKPFLCFKEGTLSDFLNTGFPHFVGCPRSCSIHIML